jgi:hypothetical protein
MEIIYPNKYQPRNYQINFWKAFDSGKYNKFVKVWHRRAGKDLTDFSLAIRECIREPQIVTYVFPTLKMGREVLWDGMDNKGNKFLDYYIPKEVIDGKPNDTRMEINFKGGSIFRVGGSDRPDSLRGGNSKLFILSEWSEHDPYTWTVIRPIILANGGKVIFNFTPKGDNHAKMTLDIAKIEDDWWWEVIKATETNVFTPKQLEDELRQMIRENGESEGRSKFEQEYMCSFDSPVIGSYYGDQIRNAEAEGRICDVPYEKELPVNTVWDLGIGDTTAIWFYQLVGREIRLIDHYEASGVGIEHYAGVLKDKGYIYGDHWAPHDIKVKEFGSGLSRITTARNLGINFRVVANQSIDDGIHAVRQVLPLCYFDKTKCERGLSALKNYTKDWDEKNKIYRGLPKHDWSSHTADSFRYLAVSYYPNIAPPPQPIKPEGQALIEDIENMSKLKQQIAGWR